MDKERVQAAEERYQEELRAREVRVLEDEYEDTLARLIVVGKRLHGESEVCMHCGLLCDQGYPGGNARYFTLYWSCKECGRKACTNCVFSLSPHGRRTLEWSQEEGSRCGWHGLVLPCSCDNENGLLTCFCDELNRLYERKPAVLLGKRRNVDNEEQSKRQRVDDGVWEPGTASPSYTPTSPTYEDEDE